MTDETPKIRVTEADLQSAIEATMPWVLPTSGPKSEIGAMRFPSRERAEEMAKRLLMDPATVYNVNRGPQAKPGEEE